MSIPIKRRELEFTERCLIEAYEEAKRLLDVMPAPGSAGWDVYVAQTYARFKESGQH